MSYRLQKEEPLASGFKRIAEEQITAAIADLQSRNIYELRKGLKKLRSVLRLLEPQLGPLYVEENHRLRDIARRFSSLRDLDMSLELLESFANQYKRKSTLNPQRKALADRQKALEEQSLELTESLDALAATRKRIEDWPLHGLTHESLMSQVEKTHKQSSHAFHRAKEDRTAEHFHELRKSVKRELNQLRLLDSSELQIRDLKQLSSLLGDHHNLVVLVANLENPSGRFRQIARGRLKHFEIQILSLAASLHSNVNLPV